MLSVHAFEMMPRVFVEGLVNIATLRPKAAVFLEPIEELWPGMSLSCMLARLRVRRLDRLSGFHKHAAALGKVVEARFLGDAINPLNPTSVMVVEFGERRS